MPAAQATDPDVERELVALARAFAEREIRPVAARHDTTGEVPWEVIRKAAAPASPRSTCRPSTAEAGSSRC